MRTKNFVLFLICIVGTSVFLCLVGNQRPSIQTIVTETHKQLNNLKNFKDNLKDAEEKRLVADEKYLTLLGFTEHPRLYPEAVWKNTSLPLIVTYVNTDQEQQAVGLIRNVQHFLPNQSVVVYNLGLSQYGFEMLSRYCNSSRCVINNFDYELFPSHVQEERLHAYRPLIIQDALDKAGAVLFIEVDLRLTTGHLEPILQTARSGGVASWATHHATSSLTHPKMFDYFHTSSEYFFFLPMVQSSHILLYNTASVHTKLMLPWVQCALTQDCIDPIGAQSSGCRFNKKPLYRYSGCHRYDGSALNIVLGIMFEFKDSSYVYSGREIFRKVREGAEFELEKLGENSTVSTVIHGL